MFTVYYWVHHESECVGTCTSREEMDDLLNAEPLLHEIRFEDYNNFKQQGYEE